MNKIVITDHIISTLSLEFEVDIDYKPDNHTEELKLSNDFFDEKRLKHIVSFFQDKKKPTTILKKHKDLMAL